MEQIYTTGSRTIEPKNYSVWAIDRATKKEVEFQVQAFSNKEAIEIARKAYNEKNPDGCRIRVCVEAEKFEKAKTDWITRLEANRVKNNGRKIGLVKEISDIIADAEKTSKVMEVLGMSEFLDYID